MRGLMSLLYACNMGTTNQNKDIRIKGDKMFKKSKAIKVKHKNTDAYFLISMFFLCIIV